MVDEKDKPQAAQGETKDGQDTSAGDDVLVTTPPSEAGKASESKLKTKDKPEAGKDGVSDQSAETTVGGPAPAAPPPRGSGNGFVAGLMASSIVVIGLMVAGYMWRDQLVELVSPGGNQETARIAELEERLAELEAADHQQRQVSEAIANTLDEESAALNALSNSVARLEEGGNEAIASDMASARDMIQSLEERIAAFEAETGEVDPLLSGDTNPGQQAQSSGDITEMKDALGTLTQRFEAMNQSLAETGGRVEALERVAPPEDLAEVLQGLSPRTEIEDLAARLAAIEEADPEGAARSAVIALAATELARAAATSAPFTTELEAFAVLAPDNSFVAALAPLGQQGVATKKLLLIDFEHASRAIQQAERVREGGGFWNWLVNQFTSLFSIRKVGERDGDDWQSILARAEIRIAAEDLEAAADEIRKLEGAAAQGASDWLARVDARRRVDTLVTGLTAEVFAELVTALGSE